jgi:hypothetical protein
MVTYYKDSLHNFLLTVYVEFSMITFKYKPQSIFLNYSL